MDVASWIQSRNSSLQPRSNNPDLNPTIFLSKEILEKSSIFHKILIIFYIFDNIFSKGRNNVHVGSASGRGSEDPDHKVYI